MSDKISVEQLQRNNATYAVDDFRKMVNYTSGKNKGYVRFTRGQDGNLKLEKFNNKLDVPLSWRSNTKAEHNRAMREKFAVALDGDLKYAALGTRTRISDMVLTPEDDEGRVQVGKALSRREVKKALEEFDKVYNSANGRRSILRNFFKAAMNEFGYRGDEETFKRDFMKLDKHGLDAEALEKFCCEVENPDAKKTQRERMVKSEMEFRIVITQLEGLLTAAKMRVGVDNSLKDLAREALKKGDAFGLDLKNQGGGKLISDMRACLTNLLTMNGVLDVDMAVDSRLRKALDTFLEKVLPFYVQDGIANVRDYEGDDPAKLEEALAANFDFDDVVNLAEEFVKGAAEAAKNPASATPLADEDYGILQGTMELLRSTGEKVEIKMHVEKTVIENAAIKSEYARQLASNVVSLTTLFSREASIDNFAARFVIKHFARGAENISHKDVTAMDKVKEFLQRQLVPALQLQYGERWASGNGRYTQNGGVKQYIDDLTENIKDSVDTLKCGRELYEYLFSYTLPNIINQRIDNAVQDGDRLHFIGGGDLQVACSQIVRTAMAYRDFKEKKIEGLMNKAVDGFKKILLQQQKKGNITPDQFAALLSDFNARIKSAGNRAMQRYFAESPAPVRSDNILNDIKMEVQRLVQLFQEEKGAAISELKMRLNTAILAHSIGGVEGVKAKNELMNVSKAVDDIINSLPGRNPPLDRQLTGPALRRGLEKLYFQTLDKELTARKVSKNPVNDKFVSDVRAAFAKLALDFISKAEKYGKKLDEALRRKVVEVINDQLENGGKVMRDHAALPKPDRKTLVDKLANDVMLAERNRAGALKERFLEHPEVYGKESAESVVEREFDVDYTQQNLAKTVIRAARERIFAFAAWLSAKDAGGRTFEDNLLANEKQRLQDAKLGLSTTEIANIVKPQTDAVMQRANDFLLLYTAGGKDGFETRVKKELADAVDARAKAYTNFRTQFLKLAENILNTYSSLGKETLDKRLAMVLDEASAQNPPPDAKITARAFDKMLSDMLNGIIDKKFTEYLAYSKEYTAAFENANPVLNAKIEARTEELKEAGATDEDIQFFRETIVPRFREQMEFEIGEKPKEWQGETGKEKAAKFFDDTFNRMKSDIAGIRLDPANDPRFEDNLRFVLDMLGYAEFMNDDTTKAAIKTNVTTWLKGTEVQNLMKDMRRAMMTLRIYGRGTKAAPAQAATETVNKFYADLLSAVVGVKGQILMGTFNKLDLEPALKLFEVWLEHYDLPKTQIKRGNDTITLRDMAKEHFTARVRDLQQRIANEGAIPEPILSQEYIKSFLTFINEYGTSLMLQEMKDEVKAQETERMYATNREIFDDESAKLNQDSSDKVAAIVVNKFSLNELLDKNMEIVEKEMHAETPSLESLQRWRQDIKDRFAKHMCNTNSFRVSCDSRVRHMQQLDQIVTKSQAFLFNAIAERFGGEDIMTSTKIKDSTRAGGEEGGVTAFIGAVMNTFSKQVAIKADALKRSAIKLRNPLGAQKVFLTDTEGNPALSNEFRDLARACVKAACETKAFAGLVKKIDKELGTGKV